MSLDDKEVKHIARLSSLSISDEEIPKVKDQLNGIFEYIDRLSEIPTRGVQPTYYVNELENVFREDVIQPSLSTEAIEQNAPSFADSYFRVPHIIKKS